MRRFRTPVRASRKPLRHRRSLGLTVEPLEDRQLLSGSAFSNLGNVPVQFNLLDNGHLLMTQGGVQTDIASGFQGLYQGKDNAGHQVAFDWTQGNLNEFNPQTSKAAALTEKFGGSVFQSVDDLLADARVDAVHVLTPTKYHVPTALQVLCAGKHVLVEKPVAETEADLISLKQTALTAKRVCMPAHNYIYVPSVQRMRRLIEKGQLGQIASLWIIYNIFHPEEVAALYGGVLREVCIHHAYSLLYLLGRPRRLVAMTSRIHYKQSACEDQAVIICEMPGGALADLWCSFAANDPTNDPWTVVYKVLGTSGGANYSWNEAQFEDRGGPAWGLTCYEEGFAGEIDHFISRCILDCESPLSTLDDAVDALRILDAAENSASNPQGFEAISYDHRQ